MSSRLLTRRRLSAAPQGGGRIAFAGQWSRLKTNQELIRSLAMTRYLPPALLVALSFVVFGGLVAVGQLPAGYEAATAPLTLAAAAANVIGSDWLLVRLGLDAGSAPAHGRPLRLAVIFLLGIPTAALALGLGGLIALSGDNGWMALPFALGPALLVWPFVLFAAGRALRPAGSHA
jgi:hypothetical protein